MTDQQLLHDDANPKPMEVELPAKYHLWLHLHGALHGTDPSGTIAEALEHYFENGPRVESAEDGTA